MFICAYSKMYIIEDPCSESTNKNQANRKLSLFDDTELSLIMNDGITTSSSNGGGSDFKCDEIKRRGRAFRRRLFLDICKDAMENNCA